MKKANSAFPWILLFLFYRMAFFIQQPDCKHGGTGIISNGHFQCRCPQDRTNAGPLCELVRVNFETLETALVVKQENRLSLPLKISLEFVSNDFRGTGSLLTLGDAANGLLIELALNYGRPIVSLNSEHQVSKLRSLHNNQWHRLDLFIHKTPNGAEVVVIVDRCFYGSKCAQKLSFSGIPQSAAVVSDQLKLGGFSYGVNRLKELCLENIIVNSELVDLWDSTKSNLQSRGCSKCEEACMSEEWIGGTSHCGEGAVCRNPIVAATDQYTCICKPGFQKESNDFRLIENKHLPSAPCTQAATEWEIIGSVRIEVIDLNRFTLQLSLRTRENDTNILRSGDDVIRLEIRNKYPVFRYQMAVITLPTIDVSDGRWHTFSISSTSTNLGISYRMLELSVDGLFNSFYNSTIVVTESEKSLKNTTALQLNANSSCLSDVRLEMRDNRNNNIYHVDLINELNEDQQQSLQRGCPTEDLCQSQKPCGSNEVCITEWRSYKCMCKDGFAYHEVSPKGQYECVWSTCEPDLCQHEGRCSVLENKTVSWGNETVGVMCECPPGWSGLFCEVALPTSSGYLNWWLLPFLFFLILTTFWVLCLTCWWTRRRMKKKCASVYLQKRSRILVEPLGRLSTNGISKADEEDYRGPLNLGALKMTETQSKQGQLAVIPGFSNYSVRSESEMTRTPNSATEGERFLTMDQPLQYAFEGYDSSPPLGYFSPNIYNFSDRA